MWERPIFQDTWSAGIARLRRVSGVVAIEYRCLSQAREALFHGLCACFADAVDLLEIADRSSHDALQAGEPVDQTVEEGRWEPRELVEEAVSPCLDGCVETFLARQQTDCGTYLVHVEKVFEAELAHRLEGGQLRCFALRLVSSRAVVSGPA